MKKFFSLFAAVLFAGSMFAAEVTVSKTVEELATANSWANATVVTPFALDEVITVSTDATDANTGKYYTSGQQVRLYQTGAAKLIISAAEGYSISSITLTYASQNNGILLEAESGVAVDFDNVESATFTVGNSGEATNGQARITAISVTYNGEGEVEPKEEFYLTGDFRQWATTAESDFKFAASSEAGIYTLDIAFENGAEVKAIGLKEGEENVNWYPGGMDNNLELEAGEYTISLCPAGNMEGWHEGVLLATLHEPLADPANCAEAAAAALSVSANNELYNNGKEYTIEGYVTSIATAFNPTYSNVSFWMADEAEGGNVLQAYRAACASADEAPNVGDKVKVTGTLTKYNTTPEFSAGCTFEIIEHAQVEEPENLGEMSIAEFLELKNFTDTCILTGVVDSIKNTLYGNLYLSDATAQVYVYGVLTPEGESKQFESLGVEEGDILTIKAIYNEYNNAPQVKNAIFVSVEKAPVPDEWDVIFWEDAIAADDLAEDARFGIFGSEFVVAITDPDNKMSVDANSARFGDAEAYTMYTHRLKTGGKSSSTKNFITLEIPEDGTLRLAVRTGSNGDTLRTLIVTQEEVELYNNYVKETQAISVMEDETEVKVYPYVEVPVKAGNVVLSYPVNGLNFYAFAFKPAGPAQEIVDVMMTPDNATMSWTDNCSSYGWWQITAKNDVFVVSLSNINRAEAAGTYTINDLDHDYCYINVLPSTDRIYFVDGEIKVEVTDETIIVSGELIGEDGNTYSFTLMAANGGGEEENPYEYDNDSDFIRTFSEYTVDDQYLAEYGDVYVDAQDEEGYMIALDIYAGSEGLVPGTFEINDSYETPSVAAGLYYEGGIYPSYAGIATSAGLTNVWYLVSGTVTIDDDLNITVEAQNSLGHTIKASLQANSDPQGITETEAADKAAKALREGHLFIMKGDKTYNVLGIEVR